jgi:hypothetical protein
VEVETEAVDERLDVVDRLLGVPAGVDVQQSGRSPSCSLAR